MSATRLSAGRPGWQQVKISRSRSSGMASGSVMSGCRRGAERSLVSEGSARASARRARRRWSSARRRAVVRSQAPGRSGDAGGGPVIERLPEGLLDDLLRRVDVANDPEHGGDDAPVLLAEGLRHACAHAVVRRPPGSIDPTGRWYAIPRPSCRWRVRSDPAAPRRPASAVSRRLTSARSAAPRRTRPRGAGSSSPTRRLPAWSRTRPGRSRPGPPSSR